MKIVIDSFDGGLSSSENHGNPNQYHIGERIDPYRVPGFLMPGTPATTIAKSDDAVYTTNITDFAVDTANNLTYGLGAGKLYQIDSSARTITTGAVFPHTVSASTRSEDTELYYIGATQYLFYFYQTDAGRYDLSTTFDDDWLSTVPAAAAALADNPHPVMEWANDGILYIGDGRNLKSLDGQTGANGTFDPAALDLPYGWIIRALFPTKNYIGICASKGDATNWTQGSDSAVFLWDGFSSAPNSKIVVQDNLIDAAYSHQGIIYLWTRGKDRSTTLWQLGESGASKLKLVQNQSLGYAGDQFYIDRNNVDSFSNRVLFGLRSNKDLIFSYGQPEVGKPYALTLPLGGSGGTGSFITALKVVENFPYIAYYDGTLSRLGYLASGGDTAAVWKKNYFVPPQKVRINYIKFYFKALASGDDLTPTIEVDYGTSVPLKALNGSTDIAYATDGAITSKRFDVKKDCHAFRPVITYDGGITKFSKIVIDYQYVTDN